jgi:hypothetical protein
MSGSHRLLEGKQMVAPAYTSKLNDVFDRVYVHGVAEVPRAELLLWHDNLTKVTKKLWRNVQEGWTSRCRDEWGYDKYIPTILRAYNPYTSTYVLIWADDDTTEGRQPWFKPLNEVNERAENEAEEDAEE